MTTKTYTVAELRHSTMTSSFVRAEELAEEKTASSGIYQQLEICQKQRDAVREELAALREELADCKRSNEIIRNQRPSEIFDQRLIYAEQRNDERLKDAYQWGYGDGQNNPNGYSNEADISECISALNKPKEDKPIDPSIIGIEPMPPMEYDEP